MKRALTYLFPVIFLLFLLKNIFAVDFSSDMKVLVGQSLSKIHNPSLKIFEKEKSQKHNIEGFKQDFTDDDIQFSDYSFISFIASVVVLFNLALHFLYREKSLSPFTLFLLNRNVNRRYILLENLRL